MRIAVTGAAGLLAAAVLPVLRAAGHETHALGREVDVTDPAALRHAIAPIRPDWIVHLAAFTRVDECESDERRAHLVNGLGARNAARAAAGSDASLLALSTDYVFDGRAGRPCFEYDVAAPLNAYGRSKWAGEQAIRELAPRHAIVRTAWLFGPGGRNFVDTMVERARSGQPLAVVDDQRGSPTYTRDLADQMLRIIEGRHFGTFHVVNAGAATWHELASHAVARAGMRVTIGRLTTAELGRPAPRPACSVLDATASERVIGHALPDWRDAVDRHLAESEGGGDGAGA